MARAAAGFSRRMIPGTLYGKSQATRIALAIAALVLSLTSAALADGPSPVPEPGTLGLIGLGFAGLCLLVRRRRQ
jgi:hypothetical protein